MGKEGTKEKLDIELEAPADFTSPEVLYQDLVKTIHKYHPSDDISMIEKAYKVAAEAHKDQKRKSGEPYIIHPLCVAIILADLEMDKETIAAGLLHDVVEDTVMTLDELTKEFGPEVAFLVDGVTKLTQLNWDKDKVEIQAENLRKMFLAMAKDIRVILIKLADRLHNIRTMDAQSEEKRREKALETIEVYAPLAHRLGIQSLKTELEDTSLKYLDPVGYNEIVADLKSFNANSDVLNEIRGIITDKLAEVGIKARVTGRIKHIYSIYRKMFNQNKQFNEIYDLYAFRIIVEKVNDCYNALGYMHDIFRAIPGRLKDYIATPKPNMYQSLHTTVSYKGHIFEIQIRTEEMHRIAEMGIAAHWKYKSGESASAEMDSKLAWVRKLLEVQDNVNEHDDFVQTFKIDLFADQVFVSTPRGDIITLPADSNPIDFAYAIHSAIGNKMIGAKVNGRMVELTTHLRNGDVCEILTSSNSTGPSRDWLKLVRTNEAKSKIRQWFKKEKKEENIVNGREDLERELRRINVTFNVFTREEVYANVMKHYQVETLDEFYAMIGYGGISISKILPRIKDDYTKLIRQREATTPDSPTLQKPKKAVNGVVVEGIDNCLVRLARCCVPLPGDDIIGFVTRGYGVAVHKCDCPNVKNADPERLVSVHWEGYDNGYFATSLVISAFSRIDLMADITSALAAMRIALHSMSSKEMNDGCSEVYITIDVHGLDHLRSVCSRLEKIRSVFKIERGTLS